MRSVLPEPNEITTLGVAAAWRAASRLQGTGEDFVIGIAKEGQGLIARGALNSYAQVQKFAHEMARLGFVASVGEQREWMRGCDIFFAKPVDAPAVTEPAPHAVRDEAVSNATRG